MREEPAIEKISFLGKTDFSASLLGKQSEQSVIRASVQLYTVHNIKEIFKNLRGTDKYPLQVKTHPSQTGLSHP